MNSDVVTALAAEAGGEDPIEALRAVSRLHRELAGVEALAVRRARNAGASWQFIALALGVSRQAVHKKYGRS